MTMPTGHSAEQPDREDQLGRRSRAGVDGSDLEARALLVDHHSIEPRNAPSTIRVDPDGRGHGFEDGRTLRCDFVAVERSVPISVEFAQRNGGVVGIEIEVMTDLAAEDGDVGGGLTSVVPTRRARWAEHREESESRAETPPKGGPSGPRRGSAGFAGVETVFDDDSPPAGR